MIGSFSNMRWVCLKIGNRLNPLQFFRQILIIQLWFWVYPVFNKPYIASASISVTSRICGVKPPENHVNFKKEIYIYTHYCNLKMRRSIETEGH